MPKYRVSYRVTFELETDYTDELGSDWADMAYLWLLDGGMPDPGQLEVYQLD